MLTATPLQGPAPVVLYSRQQPALGELGLDIPGLDTMAILGKTIYYVGVGTALIAASIFVWKVTDAVFGD